MLNVRHGPSPPSVPPSLPSLMLPSLFPARVPNTRRRGDAGRRQPLPGGGAVPVPPARRPPLHPHRWVACYLLFRSLRCRWRGLERVGLLSAGPPLRTPLCCTSSARPAKQSAVARTSMIAPCTPCLPLCHYRRHALRSGPTGQPAPAGVQVTAAAARLGAPVCARMAHVFWCLQPSFLITTHSLSLAGAAMRCTSTQPTATRATASQPRHATVSVAGHAAWQLSCAACIPAGAAAFYQPVRPVPVSFHNNICFIALVAGGERRVCG